MGAAAGAGIGLMLACDFVVAAPTDPFTLAYPKIGAAIDGGASWFLPRLVGTRKAKELAFLSDPFDGTEAEQLGLVTRLVSPETLQDEALRFCATLAAGPTEAFGAIKQLVDHALSRSLETQLNAERDAFVEIARNPISPRALLPFARSDLRSLVVGGDLRAAAVEEARVLAPKPGTTDQAFVQHWREVHGPIVALTPGYADWRWRYVQNHVRGPGPVGTDFPYRGMAAFWLPGDLPNEDEFSTTAALPRPDPFG